MSKLCYIGQITVTGQIQEKKNMETETIVTPHIEESPAAHDETTGSPASTQETETTAVGAASETIESPKTPSKRAKSHKKFRGGKGARRANDILSKEQLRSINDNAGHQSLRFSKDGFAALMTYCNMIAETVVGLVPINPYESTNITRADVMNAIAIRSATAAGRVNTSSAIGRSLGVAKQKSPAQSSSSTKKRASSGGIGGGVAKKVSK